MSTGKDVRLRFGDFEFDAQSHTLFRDGWRVKIQPQPLRVLAVLLERPGEIVSREQLQAQIWGDSTFVEFDQGLNYSIRQIRLALRDQAANPTYIETLPKQGYRFLAKVQPADSIEPPLNPPKEKAFAEVSVVEQLRPLPVSSRKWRMWLIATTACLALAAAGFVYLTRVRRAPSSPARSTQLTDLTDSAIAPVLSPDGHMVAFFRGDKSFFTGDQIYIKMLPNGATKRLTDDKRYKYSLAFSPDSSQIAYTVVDDSDTFSTYTVSVLGGESHLLLNNAAGLTWLDKNQLLFSQIKSGLHLGIVTGTVTHDRFREIYFPPHERAMAHYSFASPDRRTALVVEMNERGEWTPCRLISLSGAFQPKPVGPDGFCTSAAWSPEGAWMYFVAVVNGESHLWRARFPGGRPEQLTFGPTEEDGVAPEQDSRSVITAMGIRTNTLWMHDEKGERALLSEGEIVPYWSPPSPSFSADGKILYYLLRHRSGEPEPELWRTDLASGVSEAVFPGLCMRTYAISADNRQVLYTTAVGDGKPRLWIAPIDKSSPPKPIGHLNDRAPYFGPQDEVLFEFTEGVSNYIGRMDQDGLNRSKLVPYAIDSIYGISPGRRWIVARIHPSAGEPLPGPVAIPTMGGRTRHICVSECLPTWSLDGKFLFVPVQISSSTSPGRSLAIPLGPGEDLSALPPEGIKPMAQAGDVPGSRSIDRTDFVPGKNLSDFAYVKTTMHYNLFRVQVP